MILYLFIDGIGFGKNNPDINPFSRYAKGFFLPLAEKPLPVGHLLNKGIYHPTDPQMGVTGLPQSATGQTAIWTGINAPQVLGRHVSGFPSFTLKKIISKFSIVKILEDNKKKASFLNCYSPPFFENINKHKRYLSASTLVQLASNVPLKTFEDLKNRKGIFMDITHHILREFAKDFLPESHELMLERNPFEMGRLAVQLARENELTLYEYFLTDKVGHARDWNLAQKVISDVENFIDGILAEMDESHEQLIITSDHGNLEDLSTDVHTNNLVPTFLYGKYSKELAEQIHYLCDIVPAIYKILDIKIDLEFQKDTPDSVENSSHP